MFSLSFLSPSLFCCQKATKILLLRKLRIIFHQSRKIIMLSSKFITTSLFVVSLMLLSCVTHSTATEFNVDHGPNGNSGLVGAGLSTMNSAKGTNNEDVRIWGERAGRKMMAKTKRLLEVVKEEVYYVGGANCSPSLKSKLNDFIADYNVPRSHPPKNN